MCAARASLSTAAEAPDLELLLFTEVAGATNPVQNQWDVLLADAVVQHDMDASPLFSRFTLPSLNRDRFKPDPSWFSWVEQALKRAVDNGEPQGFGSF